MGEGKRNSRRAGERKRRDCYFSAVFHDGSGGDPTSPSNFLSGSLGRHSLDRDFGGHGADVARRALLDDVLPVYNTVRFGFRFTDEELADLAEFLLSL